MSPLRTVINVIGVAVILFLVMYGIDVATDMMERQSDEELGLGLAILVGIIAVVAGIGVAIYNSISKAVNKKLNEGDR